MVSVQDMYWRPGLPSSGEPAMCRIARCRYELSRSYNAEDPEPCRAPSGLEGVPDFTKPRLIVWYQSHCIACQNSEEKVFPAITRAAQERGFTVHKQEATPEMLKRFPHVTMVPLYDIVLPSDDPQACSAYGPRTTVRSIRNDLRALKTEFPTFSITQ